MLHIYVDADACPVKKEVYRVANRYHLEVTLVTNTWMRIPRHLLSFRDVSMALLASDLSLTGGRYRQIIRGSLAWREITLPTMGGRSHQHHVVRPGVPRSEYS